MLLQTEYSRKKVSAQSAALLDRLWNDFSDSISL